MILVPNVWRAFRWPSSSLWPHRSKDLPLQSTCAQHTIFPRHVRPRMVRSPLGRSLPRSSRMLMWEATTVRYAVSNISMSSQNSISIVSLQLLCQNFLNLCPLPPTPPLDLTNWFATPKPNPLPAPKQPSGERLKVLHISDFHLDASAPPTNFPV